MAVTGIVAPRVVVSPPNTPAPPPISLLTQNNTITDDRDVMSGADDQNQWRWEAGGGVTWLSPFRYAPRLWQRWHDSGSDTGSKGALDGIGNHGIIGGNDFRPYGGAAQLPIVAQLEVTQGALTDWALRTGVEGTPEEQLLKALSGAMPRVIEAELWAANEMVAAGWSEQFRLTSDAVSVHVAGDATKPWGIISALAAAEQAAADREIIDLAGGAFIHCSPRYASLLASVAHGLTYSPTGRQITTTSGCHLVPEPGATGTWFSDTGLQDAPAGIGAGDNSADGWLFVTPPVRVRLGAPNVTMRGNFDTDTNDWTIVA